MFSAQKISTCCASDSGWYCGCLRISVRALPALELAARRRVEVAGAELRERLQLAELRQVDASWPATCFIALRCAALPTRETERPALMAGRMPALNRSVSRKIWPSVIEMTFVGM